MENDQSRRVGEIRTRNEGVNSANEGPLGRRESGDLRQLPEQVRDQLSNVRRMKTVKKEPCWRSKGESAKTLYQCVNFR